MEKKLVLDEFEIGQLEDIIDYHNKGRAQKYKDGYNEGIEESVRQLYIKMNYVNKRVLFLQLPYEGAQLGLIKALFDEVKNIEAQIEQNIGQKAKLDLAALGLIQASKRNLFQLIHSVQNNLPQEKRQYESGTKDYKKRNKLKLQLSPSTQFQLDFLEAVVMRSNSEKRESEEIIKLAISAYWQKLFINGEVCEIYIPVARVTLDGLKKMEEIMTEWIIMNKIKEGAAGKLLEEGVKEIRGYIRTW